MSDTKQLSELRQKQIDDILASFQFDRVARALVAVGDYAARNGFPRTSEQLKECAREMLTGACIDFDELSGDDEHRSASHSTGGFYARVTRTLLTLDFTLEDAVLYID